MDSCLLWELASRSWYGERKSAPSLGMSMTLASPPLAWALSDQTPCRCPFLGSQALDGGFCGPHLTTAGWPLGSHEHCSGTQLSVQAAL